MTAIHICVRDETHRETETVTTIAEITKSPTEMSAGQRTYTSAPYKDEAFSVQQVTVDDLPALNTLNLLKLPASTRTVEDEAFEGGAFQAVIIPNDCARIGSRAFANCENLLYVYIPAGVTEIAEDAFLNNEETVIDRK